MPMSQQQVISYQVDRNKRNSPGRGSANPAGPGNAHRPLREFQGLGSLNSGLVGACGPGAAWDRYHSYMPQLRRAPREWSANVESSVITCLRSDVITCLDVTGTEDAPHERALGAATYSREKRVRAVDTTCDGSEIWIGRCYSDMPVDERSSSNFTRAWVPQAGHDRVPRSYTGRSILALVPLGWRLLTGIAVRVRRLPTPRVDAHFVDGAARNPA